MGLLVSNVILRRSLPDPAAVIEGVTYSTALVRAPLKIVWTEHYARHQTTVDLDRGTLAPVTRRQMHTGHTNWWRVT